MDPKTLRQIEDDEMFAHLELDIEQIKTLRVAVDEDVPMKMWSRACITRSSLPLLRLLVPSLKRIASWRISVYLGFESFYGIFTFVPIHRNELLQYPWNFHTHAYRTYFRYSCIYICMLVSLRFESSRCMNILIAFDCAAINVEYEYEMSVKNQRCPTGMISEFLASVSLINGRVTDTTSRWHRVKSLSPPPLALVSRTKRRVNLRGLATARTRNFCLDVCPVYRYTFARISSGARGNRSNRESRTKYPKNYNIRGACRIVIFIVPRK